MNISTDSVRRLFEKYANLEIGLADMRDGLGSSWSFERSSSHYSLGLTPVIEPPILIGPNQLKHALEVLVAGRIDAAALQDWANLLVLCDAYQIGRPSNSDEREMLLTLLHAIATPEVHGPLTVQRIENFRDLLEK